jgi:hypothetical protein
MEHKIVGKSQGKRAFAQPTCRREYNIKMDQKEIGCEGVEFTQLAQYRVEQRVLANRIMRLRVSPPSKKIQISKKGADS